MSSTNINFSVDEISQQNKAKKLKEGVNHQGAQKKCGSGVKQGCVTNAKNEPEKRAHTLDPFADSLLSPASRAIMKKFSCPEAAKQQEKKALGVYKKELPTDVEKMKKTEKDREKSIGMRQQLEGQLTENNLVKAEFDLLEDDAKVFKLIGPVLVKQDLTEARQNVQKRLEYITAEIKRVEGMIGDFDKQIKEQTEGLTKSQATLKQQLAIHHAQSK
ncbi:hypothetical protein QR680_017074 [Steinernema hermaphroditum]|uniref:Probable prefoldin subunit 6 n=1 Tax=Steinernema hermaphroditum TaxID=289476 RepID=A0AA39LNN9_9BILA|nr:hypothetical protein QR680_017074 [Steinernema hermaphroditum]